MTKLSLPIRKKIRKIHSDKYEREDIFRTVREDALKEVDSEEEVWKCINEIIKKVNNRKYSPKAFQVSKYIDDVNSLKLLDPKKFEAETLPIAEDLLIKHENFKRIYNANKQTHFNNPPFDFLGIKDSTRFIIEYKGRFDQIGGINKNQRQRQLVLLKEIKGLKSALIQINFSFQEYRILYDKQIDDCYPAKEIPMDSIINWIRSKM